MAFRVSPRLGASMGLLGVLAWLVLYFVAAASLPDYTLLANNVSDLGGPNSPGAWAFNAGCILAGLLFVPLALGFSAALSGRSANLGSALLGIAAVFVALVGVFPEESPPDNIHFWMSAGFFLALFGSSVFLAYPLHESRAFGRLSAYLAGATAAAAVATIATRAEPIVEHLTVYLGLLWGARVSGRMWTMGPVPRTAPS